jgi:hypothetical protein
VFERVISDSVPRLQFLQFPLFAAFPLKTVSLLSVNISMQQNGEPRSPRGSDCYVPKSDLPRLAILQIDRPLSGVKHSFRSCCLTQQCYRIKFAVTCPFLTVLAGDEVWRRGRHLSPLLQQLCRSCETVLASPRYFVRPLARETEAGSAETQAGKE